MRPWEIVKIDLGRGEDYIILPRDTFYCPVCGEPLLFHDYLVGWNGQFYHADIHMKCPRCGLYLTFGVPIDKNEYDKLLHSRYLRKILTVEVTRLLRNDHDLEKIKERLERWGYW